MPRASNPRRSSPPSRPTVPPRASARPGRITRQPTILDAINDPASFGKWFPGPSWDRWKTVLKAGEGLPLNAAELEFFKSISGGREPPTSRVREQWWVAERRAGKDSTASTVAAFTAGMFKQQQLLLPGEWASVMCLAVDRDQAKDILDFIRQFFTDIPFLETMVERETADGFELNNRVRISVQTNSFRAVRGRTILLAILNEVAYWRDDKSARPDEELYRAIKPGLLSLSPHSRLIGISSPYQKAGLLYKKCKDHFGKNDDTLVLQAGTTTMNPVVSPEEIEREIAKDPAAGIAEYGAQFRDDIGGWLPMEIVEAAVCPWCHRAATVSPARVPLFRRCKRRAQRHHDHEYRA